MHKSIYLQIFVHLLVLGSINLAFVVADGFVFNDTNERRLFVPDNPGGEGRNLFDLIGLGTGPEKDPYVARTNAQCINGDLADCFKARALSALDEIFEEEKYNLNEHVQVVRMPQSQLRSLQNEPYEYSGEPKSTDSEWDQLSKFLMRRVEKFLKSRALVLEIPEEMTEQGKYTPRFLDEIEEEINVIEDKKDNYFTRKRLRKLVIPFLIVLKLFKLKLLLFLPLILGLASFKKFLGFLAIAIPGLIGYLKLCKGSDNFGNYGNNYGYHNSFPQYSSAGLGQFSGHHLLQRPFKEYGHGGHGGHSGVSFDNNYSQNLAYNGYYPEYRSKNIESESKKKSILPDSK